MRVILTNSHLILLGLLSPSPLRLWPKGMGNLLWWKTKEIHFHGDHNAQDTEGQLSRS